MGVPNFLNLHPHSSQATDESWYTDLLAVYIDFSSLWCVVTGPLSRAHLAVRHGCRDTFYQLKHLCVCRSISRNCFLLFDLLLIFEKTFIVDESGQMKETYSKNSVFGGSSEEGCAGNTHTDEVGGLL
ncbi:hypothetical protein EVAR_22330_1 [Eumeta japonica]|uniref:Uncharacterized protein n=1 Tax=Eumeta variegata TaxID=151549 RepID=A0A4C1UBF8_EUMVA|nr:hypothetical protein EVAR_22330_1 [Eumeta japonica]